MSLLKLIVHEDYRVEICHARRSTMPGFWNSVAECTLHNCGDAHEFAARVADLVTAHVRNETALPIMRATADASVWARSIRRMQSSPLASIRFAMPMIGKAKIQINARAHVAGWMHTVLKGMKQRDASIASCLLSVRLRDVGVINTRWLVHSRELPRTTQITFGSINAHPVGYSACASSPDDDDSS